jgi:hypothetical protein
MMTWRSGKSWVRSHLAKRSLLERKRRGWWARRSRVVRVRWHVPGLTSQWLWQHPGPTTLKLHPPHSTAPPPNNPSMHVLPTSHVPPSSTMVDVMDPTSWPPGGFIDDFTSPLLDSEFIALLSNSDTWGATLAQQIQPHPPIFPQSPMDSTSVLPPSNPADMTGVSSHTSPAMLNPSFAPAILIGLASHLSLTTPLLLSQPKRY